MLDLNGFIERFRNSSAAAGFILDFDGTLSEVVRVPGEAGSVAGAAGVLESLARVYRLVAVVSGRRAEDVMRIAGAKDITYMGLYGAERIEDGKLVQLPEAQQWRDIALRLARDARDLIVSEALLGAEVEYKDLAVSVHYRNATNPRAARVIEEWAVTAAPLLGFEAGVGRMVVEMRPQGVSKASAAETLIRDQSLEFAVIAGDDYQDVEAMRRAGELLGDRVMRIGVASAEQPEGLQTTADLVVHSPLEVVEMLRKFV